VPAGNTPHPAGWTPGISTGALNVMVLFLFRSSALAAGENVAPASNARQNTVVRLSAISSFFPFVALNSVFVHMFSALSQAHRELLCLLKQKVMNLTVQPVPL
jgi:hypothetical protein